MLHLYLSTSKYQLPNQYSLIMSIWKNTPTIEILNASGKGCLVEHVGIEFIEVGDDYLKARMPIDHRTTQPFGILHGGA